MIGSDDPTSGAGPRRSGATAAFLVRAYTFIVLLAVAASWASELHTGWLLALAIILGVPAALALWHRAVVRCLLSLHQFQPGRALHWIGSRLLLRKLLGAVLAVMVSYASILHASFFGLRDWLLLGLMPVLFAVARCRLQGLLRPQHTSAVYATHATLRLAGWAVALFYLLGWVGLSAAAPEAAQGGLIERVEALQAPWKAAPAASARYVADAQAWAAAGLDSINALSTAPWWRMALGVVLAPLTTVAFVALAMQGLALPAAEVRRNFSAGPSEADSPPPISPVSAGVYAAVVAVLLVILFQLAGNLEHVLGADDSPLAVRRLPQCEAIDGKVYKIGTLDSITQLLAASAAEVGHARANACGALDSAEAAGAKPIDAYLDWYFSLAAEWLRIGTMLTGNLEQMLRDRLTASLESEPAVAEALEGALRDSRAGADVLDAVQGKVKGILADNVLVLDERSCKVVRRDSIAKALAAREGESLRLRAAGSAGAGLAAGAVAGKVAAAAMTKGSMKAAVKVLAKFVSKKAATYSLSVGGMAIGSAIPGIGTIAGAGVGLVAGLAISAAVDWTALAVEEHLERSAMKAELLEALQEELASARKALGCVP